MHGVAGYSGTPLARKLGIREGARVALIAAPDDFEAAIDGLPPRVRILRRPSAPIDVAVAFFTRRAALERRVGRIASVLADDGGLWIAWPKRTSRVATDLGDGVVREIGLATGLVDNKVCAIDDVWSALRFVVHSADRPARRGP